MTLNRKLTVAAGLTIVGAAISIYQTYEFFKVRAGEGALKTFCKAGSFDCVAVEMSKYAEVLPGIPTSALASGWLLAQLIVIIIALLNDSKTARRWAAVQSTVSLATSVVLLYVMVGILKTGCVLCLSLDAVNIANFALLLPFLKEGKSGSEDGSMWKLIIGTGVGSVLAMWVLSRALNPLASISEVQIGEYVDSVLLNKPVAVSVTADDVVFGPENAAITIVKFSDFECPACKMGAQGLHPVLKLYPGQVRFAFKNHPLDNTCNRKISRPLHKKACELAKIALCVKQQGKFESYYEIAFENQEEFAKSSTDVYEVLKTHGFNTDELKACAAKPETAQKLTKQIEEGIAAGVESTPTFFVNGIKIAGGVPTTIWKALIDRLLEAKGVAK